MSNESYIGSAIQQGRGINPEELKEGSYIDLSYRCIKNMPKGARSSMVGHEMISVEDLGMVEESTGGGVINIKITHSFIHAYKNSGD